MPKVSFILPAYKRRFLKEAIDSILAQTCRDFELVIVDDKGPEELYEVIKEYPWEAAFEALPDGGRRWMVDGVPVRYYQNAVNIGGKDLVAAWNKALSYANGEWVVCAGDDDVYLPRFAEKLVTMMDKYPHVDAFHCRIAYINSVGDVERLGAPRAEYESVIQMIDHSCVTRKDQRMPDFMYRRSRLLEIGGYVQSPRAWYSDIMTAIVMSSFGGAVCCPEILFKWRQSGDNISSRSDDVDDKIEAGVQFIEWLKTLLHKVTIGSYDDELTFKFLEKGVEAECMQSFSYYLAKLRKREALQVVNRSRLPQDNKRILLSLIRRRGHSITAILHRILARIRVVIAK